jgi:hypothetical protein
MSVYKNPIYKIDCFNKATLGEPISLQPNRVCNSLLNFSIGDPEDFPVPFGVDLVGRGCTLDGVKLASLVGCMEEISKFQSVWFNGMWQYRLDLANLHWLNRASLLSYCDLSRLTYNTALEEHETIRLDDPLVFCHAVLGPQYATNKFDDPKSVGLIRSIKRMPHDAFRELLIYQDALCNARKAVVVKTKRAVFMRVETFRSALIAERVPFPLTTALARYLLIPDAFQDGDQVTRQFSGWVDVSGIDDLEKWCDAVKSVYTQGLCGLVPRTCHATMKCGVTLGFVSYFGLRRFQRPVIVPKTITRNATHKILDAYVAAGGTILSGLPAVYRYCARVLFPLVEHLSTHPTNRAESIASFTNLLATFSAVASKMQSPSTFSELEILSNCWSISLDAVTRVLRCLKLFATLRQEVKASDNRARFSRTFSKLFGPMSKDRGLKGISGCRYGRLLLLRNLKSNTEVYAFTVEDVERIAVVVRGFVTAKNYMISLPFKTPEIARQILDVYTQFQEVIHRLMRTATDETANKLAKAFDVLLHLFEAHLASDLSTRALETQLEDVKEKGFDDLLDYGKMITLLKSIPMKEAIDILHSVKYFPQADYDHYTMAANQRKLYSHTIQWGRQAERSLPGAFDMIGRQLRYHIILAYFAKHGTCPGKLIQDLPQDKVYLIAYPSIHPKYIQIADVDLIDLRNSVRFEHHHEDILKFAKDKALCPEGIQDSDTASTLSAYPIEQRNYLLNVLHQDPPYDTTICLRDFKHLNHNIRVKDKAEAKKATGRWFMEATPQVRLAISEYEHNIAMLLEKLTTVSSGKSAQASYMKMQTITNGISSLGFVSDSTPVIASFDLKKFSPSLQAGVHQMMDDIFAEIYGEPALADFAHVYTTGRIHYVEYDIHHSFEKMGRDFEGFQGRKNSLYHAAVMATVCYYLIQEGIIKTAAQFYALIDDGILRVDFPTADPVKVQAMVKRLMEIIVEVYQVACMEISWDKTFISSQFAVYLNVLYYRGNIISPGLKSIGKICNNCELPVPHLIGELAYIESSGRGAISAGANQNIVNVVMSYYVADSIRNNAFRAKWWKNLLNLALMCYAPIEWGGFSVCTIFQVSGSYGAQRRVAQIGNLAEIGAYYQYLARTLDPEGAMLAEMVCSKIDVILSVEIEEKTNVQKLLNPEHVQTTRLKLDATRLQRELSQFFMDSQQFPVVNLIFRGTRQTSMEERAKLIDWSRHQSTEILLRIAAMLPETVARQIAVKFMKEQTATSLLSAHGIRSIKRFMRLNAEKVIRNAVLLEFTNEPMDELGEYGMFSVD